MKNAFSRYFLSKIVVLGGSVSTKGNQRPLMKTFRIFRMFVAKSLFWDALSREGLVKNVIFTLFLYKKSLFWGSLSREGNERPLMKRFRVLEYFGAILGICVSATLKAIRKKTSF